MTCTCKTTPHDKECLQHPKNLKEIARIRAIAEGLPALPGWAKIIPFPGKNK
jgi:hypothetical protein